MAAPSTAPPFQPVGGLLPYTAMKPKEIQDLQQRAAAESIQRTARENTRLWEPIWRLYRDRYQIQLDRLLRQSPLPVAAIEETVLRLRVAADLEGEMRALIDVPDRLGTVWPFPDHFFDPPSPLMGSPGDPTEGGSHV